MKYLWLLLLACTCFAEEAIIKLNPPHLSESSLLEKIVCERPMRDEKLNISVEDRDEKNNCQQLWTWRLRLHNLVWIGL